MYNVRPRQLSRSHRIVRVRRGRTVFASTMRNIFKLYRQKDTGLTLMRTRDSVVRLVFRHVHIIIITRGV